MKVISAVVFVLFSLSEPVTCSDYWQSFLDEHLLSSGHLRSAVIMGNNGMVLGRSKDLDLKKWELSNLVDNIHIPAKMADQGIAFLGNKYTFLGKNDNVVRAAVRNERQMDQSLKKRLGTGLVAIKTEETLLVGTVEDKHVFKKAEKIMATVAEKLAESGF